VSFVLDMAPEDVPEVSKAGQYHASFAARCAKCSYEVDWTAFKRDTRHDGKSPFKVAIWKNS
jgi:hypothetical protein